MVKTPIQTMSSACQNRLKQSSAAHHDRPEAQRRDLRHHRHSQSRPSVTCSAVRADQREEGRQEGAARRAGALGDHAARTPLISSAEEGGAEQRR